MTEMWNSTTGTVYLRSFEKVKVANFKAFFPGVEMIVKHFKVRSCNTVSVNYADGNIKLEVNENARDVNRHYTICNVMRHSFYEPLLDCLKTGFSREKIEEVFQSENVDLCSFTVKNYKQPFGVSMKFYEERIP